MSLGVLGAPTHPDGTMGRKAGFAIGPDLAIFAKQISDTDL
jgi:hypothetical protein